MTAEGRTSEPNWRLWLRRGWIPGGTTDSPSPSAVLLQSPLKNLKQRCELLIQAAKSQFFQDCCQIADNFWGVQIRLGWKTICVRVPYKRRIRKAFILSAGFGPTANTNLIESRYMLYSYKNSSTVCLPPTEFPPDAIPTKAFPATAEWQLDLTAVTNW